MLSKACEVAGDCGDCVGDGFERCVAPGFVVGGEDSEVEAGYEVVVFGVDDSVVSVEVLRD